MNRYNFAYIPIDTEIKQHFITLSQQIKYKKTVKTYELNEKYNLPHISVCQIENSAPKEVFLRLFKIIKQQIT